MALLFSVSPVENISLELLQAASAKEIVIVHVDTPSNNWQLLFESVNSSASYLQTASGVYAQATAKSFYNQVVPKNSLNVAYSGKMLHPQQLQD